MTNSYADELLEEEDELVEEDEEGPVFEEDSDWRTGPTGKGELMPWGAVVTPPSSPFSVEPTENQE